MPLVFGIVKELSMIKTQFFTVQLDLVEYMILLLFTYQRVVYMRTLKIYIRKILFDKEDFFMGMVLFLP